MHLETLETPVSPLLLNHNMQLTAEIIANHLGGELEGRGDVLVSNFAKIEEATPGTITFLANPKYTHHIYSTGASVVLVRRDFVAEQPVKATLIRVDDPYVALSGLLGLAAKFIQPQPVGIEQPCHIADGVEISDDCYIGAFAYIGQGAKIGRGVKIYPQAYVGPGVTIGDESVIYPGAKIYYNCQIGKRCIIHAGAVIGADGFGFAPDAQGVYHKIEQIGIVVIDDDVEIGANTTVDRSTMGCTHIQRGVKLDNLIQIAHNVEVGQVGVAGHITVGDRTNIGAQSGIAHSIAPDSRIIGSPAVPGREFARIAASMRRLPELLQRVDKLEKLHQEK